MLSVAIAHDQIDFVIQRIPFHMESNGPLSKKELVKLYSRITEILGAKSAVFFQSILDILDERIHKGEPYMAGPLADTLAFSAFHALSQAERSQQVYFMSEATRRLLDNFSKKKKSNLGNSREIHENSAFALGRIFQICPSSMIIPLKGSLIKAILETLQLEGNYGRAQLLDSLICLILCVEDEIREYGEKIIADTLFLLNDSDPNVRKAECDLLYTLSVVIPNVMRDKANEIYERLEERINDGNKEVRYAASMAISVLKEYKGVTLSASNPSLSHKPSPFKPSPQSESNSSLKRTSEFKSQKQEIPKSMSKSKWNPKIKVKTPPKKTENHEAAPHKSIFERPVNEKFFRNAPKEEIEIRVIGNIRPDVTDEGEESTLKAKFHVSPPIPIQNDVYVSPKKKLFDSPKSHPLPIKNTNFQSQAYDTQYDEEMAILQNEVSRLKEENLEISDFVRALKSDHSKEIRELCLRMKVLENEFQNFQRISIEKQRNLEKKLTENVSHIETNVSPPSRETRLGLTLSSPPKYSSMPNHSQTQVEHGNQSNLDGNSGDEKNEGIAQLNYLLSCDKGSEAFGLALSSKDQSQLNYLLLRKNFQIEKLEIDIMEALLIRLKDLLLAGYEFPGRAIKILRRITDTKRQFSTYPSNIAFTGLKSFLESNRVGKFLNEEDSKNLFKVVSNLKKYSY